MTTGKIKPRIVVYGTGQYGQFITRLAVQKGWPIVAAYNRAGPKVGQDSDNCPASTAISASSCKTVTPPPTTIWMPILPWSRRLTVCR